jgi:putative transposase
LIRTMSAANALWGAPRIHGELLKLGITISQATVAKHGSPAATYVAVVAHLPLQPRLPARLDRFLHRPHRHVSRLVVFVVLAHERRRIVHINVTAHPTAAWTAQQLREAWPWDTAPRFVIRDRDAVYGPDPRSILQQMGIEDVLTALLCPWQNPFVERVIGSLRRECLDHIIVWNERSLRHHLECYLAYYHDWRTHLSLDKDAPARRTAQPPAGGTIVPVPTPRRVASPLRPSRRVIVALSAPARSGRTCPYSGGSVPTQRHGRAPR